MNQLLNLTKNSFFSAAMLVVLIGCSSAQSEPEAKPTTEKTATLPSETAMPVSPTAAAIEANDNVATPSTCDGPVKLDRTQRIAVIAKVVLEAENELEKNPDSLKEQSVRDRIGTFAAGSMADSVRFVSVDQRCWAHLYEAQTKLAAEDDTGAKSAADAWQNCIEDQFPERLALAQPYFSCFVSLKSKKK